ncbi:hypothetical protein Vafri_19612, partial [Volvox africanus]
MAAAATEWLTRPMAQLGPASLGLRSKRVQSAGIPAPHSQVVRCRRLVCGSRQGHGQGYLDRLTAGTPSIRYTAVSAATPAAEAATEVGEAAAAGAAAEAGRGEKPVVLQGDAIVPRAAATVTAAAAAAAVADARRTLNQNDNDVRPAVTGRSRRRRRRSQQLKQNPERKPGSKHQDFHIGPHSSASLHAALCFSPSPSSSPSPSAVMYDPDDRLLSNNRASTSGRTGGLNSGSSGSSSSSRRFRRAEKGGLSGGSYPPLKPQHQPTALKPPSPLSATTPLELGVDVGLEQQLQLLQLDLNPPLAQELKLQLRSTLQAQEQLQPLKREPILELQCRPHQRLEGQDTQLTAKAQEPPPPSPQQRRRTGTAGVRRRMRRFEQKEQQRLTQSMKLELATVRQQVQEQYQMLGQGVSQPPPVVQVRDVQGGFGAAAPAEPEVAKPAVESVVPSTRVMITANVIGRRSAEEEAEAASRCGSGSGNGSGGGGGNGSGGGSGSGSSNGSGSSSG